MYIRRILLSAVLYALFACTKTNSEFSFPESESLQRTAISDPVSGYLQYSSRDPAPQAKHYHKIKKLKKKLLLLCLLQNGQNTRSANAQGKFFLPAVVQQTQVNVGGSDDQYEADDEDDSNEGGHSAGVNCAGLMSSGILGHPLVGALGGLGGLGGSQPSDDGDRLYNRNINRHVIRPIYKSMKKFYRLFKR